MAKFDIDPQLNLDFVQSRRTMSAPLREEYLAICNDDWVVAVILNQAVYKVAKVLDAKAEVAERAAHMQHDLDAVAAQRLIEGDWFPFTLAQWQNLCMSNRDKSAFRRQLQKLCDHGFLAKRTNARYKDGVLDYRVCIDTIAKALLAKGYIMPQEEFKWYSLWLVQQERASRNPVPPVEPAPQAPADGKMPKETPTSPVSKSHPASKHPFVQAYCSFVKKYPNTAASEAIAARYPLPTEADIAAWNDHLVWWISLNNYNPVGFAEMMAAFDRVHAFGEGASPSQVRMVPDGGWTIWNPNHVIDRANFEDWSAYKNDPDWQLPEWQAQLAKVQPKITVIVRARQALNVMVSEYLLEHLKATAMPLYLDQAFDVQPWMILKKDLWREAHVGDSKLMTLWHTAEQTLGADDLPSFVSFKRTLAPKAQPAPTIIEDDIDSMPF